MAVLGSAERLREAQEAVAAGFDVQLLAGLLGQVRLVELAVQIGVGGGALDGRQAVAVGVIAVLGAGAASLEVDEAVPAVVADAPGKRQLVQALVLALGL